MTPAEFIDNPDWAGFLPENAGAAKTRHLPLHEDCSRLDEEKVTEHLRRGGTLGSMDGYEERPGQIAMTGAIVRAFNAREHLMIEAGTGVGKSLAYLVPAIQWAHVNDTPVIISTATRNLQSQLISSDIPRAVKILGEGARDFKVALLKGRANYLCLRAVGDFFSAGYWTMSAEEQALMPDFIKWLKSTPDGDLDRYEGLPRNLLTCPGEECGGRHCLFYSRCFIYRARKAAAEAHLVVVNHALALADATSPGANLLPPSGRIIFDEAHNLEEVATEYLSYEFSLPELTRLLNRLHRRGKGKRARASGILANVERQLAKGILSGSAAGERVMKCLNEITSITVRVVNAAEDVFDLAGLMLKPAKGREIVRYRFLGTRQYSLHGLFKSYEPEEWDEDNLFAAQTRMEAELAALVNLLHELRDELNGATPEGELNFCADLALQLEGIAEGFVAFANEANFTLRGEKETHAYWVERIRPEKRSLYIRLVAAPLSVADELKKALWDVKDSAILSSATLRVGNDFKYMAKRLGCEERFNALTAESPFDYFRQCLVLAPDCLPDPSVDAPKYAEALAAMMKDLFATTSGRALVLFTSYEMMNAVAANVRIDLEGSGIRLLVQGEGMSRESMTDQLRDDDGSPTVLFGSQSFWEGVDVAGDALSCVVIARLPFAQVADPITEARGEKIEREVGNSFRNYFLPEAVIRFRQGFGRLIRTKRDCGVVIITDPRIVTKSYGATFRKSIPASVHTVTELPELLSRVSDFLA